MRTLIITLIIGLFATLASAQNIPPVIPNTYVQDHANVLSVEDKQVIQTQLNQLKQKYNLEFAIATIPTLNGADKYEYSLEMARQYGVGPKDGEKRGLMLFLSINDRKWQFQVSRHMEGVITDGQAGSIGRNVLVPKLKIASQTGTSEAWKDAFMTTITAVDGVVAENIEAERKGPPPPKDYTGLVIGGGLLGILGIGVGAGFLINRKRKRDREAVEEVAREQLRQAQLERQEQARKEYAKQAIREAAEREKARIAHEAWLKTPEGVADTKRREAEKRRLAEEARKKQLAHEAWLRTPEGIAHTQAMEAAARRAAEEERRQQQAAEARRKREEEEEEERRRRRRDEESSYSSSYSSSSSSYSSSSDSSSSGGFGGGGDFGGGGAGGDW